MKRLALVFHLNQLTGPYIRTAASASYRLLLETLREYPTIPVHIHASGTLLAGLPWYAPDVLDLLRQGVNSGQFELLGSTYAQNIPFSTAQSVNELQISAHRDQLDRLFGARCVGFWNPERCWSDAYLPLATRGGYRYMFVETSVLRAAQLPERTPSRVLVLEGSAIWLVPDSPTFRSAFNLAVWSGEQGPLRDQLASLEPGGLLVHAEDAESVGLWAFERGQSPATDRDNLARVLGWLAQNDQVEVCHLSQALRTRPPPPHDPIDAVRSSARDLAGASGDLIRMPSVRGQADWMVRALADRSLPYHEDGYADWFDFNERAPRLAHFRKLHAEVTAAFFQVVTKLRAPLPDGARRLVERARETLCAAQYEFGCVGVGATGWPAWELCRAALLLIHAAARAARVAEDVPGSGAEVADHDHDGVDEIFLQVGSELAILTPLGGRVLAWIDLATGEVLGGAALGLATPGEYSSVAHPYVGPDTSPPTWTPPAAPLERTTVPADRAWFGRLLAAHIPDLARYKATLEPLPGREAHSRERHAPPAPAQTLRRVGLFADEIAGLLVTGKLEYTAGRTEVAFHTSAGPKVIRLTRGVITADYPAGYGAGAAVMVRCELLPDRRARTTPSGPPLRLDAPDGAVSVEVDARPEPTFALWEEIPLAWMAGLAFSTRASVPLPALHVELSRHP